MKSNGILGFYLLFFSACVKPVDSAGPPRPAAVAAPETVWNVEVRLETTLLVEGLAEDSIRWLESAGTTSGTI